MFRIRVYRKEESIFDDCFYREVVAYRSNRLVYFVPAYAPEYPMDTRKLKKIMRKELCTK